MPNTLGLDDDLDPVEALISLEKAFALKTSDAEAAACRTAGDIYDLLESRFTAQMGERGPCMTSMTFYNVRKSLRGMRPDLECRPDTSLAIYAGKNARGFLDRLRRSSGLRMPGPQGRLFSDIGCLLALLGLVGAAVAATIGAWALCLAALLGLLLGATLIRLDPGAFPEDCATVGDLVLKAAALNYGSLAMSGAAVRPKDLWRAMAEVLSAHSDLPTSAIRRDTLILQSTLAEPA